MKRKCAKELKYQTSVKNRNGIGYHSATKKKRCDLPLVDGSDWCEQHQPAKPKVAKIIADATDEQGRTEFKLLCTCGNSFWLSTTTSTCDTCHTDYNKQGQILSNEPPNQEDY